LTRLKAPCTLVDKIPKSHLCALSTSFFLFVHSS
jgi:hypothetical protein